MDRETAYRLLDLPESAQRAQVEQKALRRAYRRKLHEWHPDHFQSNPDWEHRAHQMTQLVIEAYQFLEGVETGGSVPHHDPAVSRGAAASSQRRSTLRANPLLQVLLFPYYLLAGVAQLIVALLAPVRLTVAFMVLILWFGAEAPVRYLKHSVQMAWSIIAQINDSSLISDGLEGKVLRSRNNSTKWEEVIEQYRQIAPAPKRETGDRTRR